MHLRNYFNAKKIGISFKITLWHANSYYKFSKSIWENKIKIHTKIEPNMKHKKYFCQLKKELHLNFAYHNNVVRNRYVTEQNFCKNSTNWDVKIIECYLVL